MAKSWEDKSIYFLIIQLTLLFLKQWEEDKVSTFLAICEDYYKNEENLELKQEPHHILVVTV